MLRQCSRDTPKGGEGSWRPEASDIGLVEAALPALLAVKLPDYGRHPQRWQRQYVGIVRGGKRYIYGNFFPSFAEIRPGAAYDVRADPAKTVRIVCDGGSSYFGVEWDVEHHKFSQVAFNGFA
jgi:hypothetical protein